MDYSIFINSTSYRSGMLLWLEDTVGIGNYLVDPKAWTDLLENDTSACVIYFMFKVDLLAFRLRWGV